MLTLYFVVVGLTAVERLLELVVSGRNARWSFDRGGVESGRGHFPAMVLLHTALLVACVVEVLVADRPFLPWLGWPALALVVASQALRWWCIATLGPRWNTRVIVVRDLPLVSHGPYRFFRHPNYVAVVVEGIALPLVHTAWVTALVFTLLNAVLLLRFRIPAEERALQTVPA
ncbi:isoprenylcysteine carboxyl methyltransferase family protein [Cellulomonas xiejunii]|uniref:Isoprenylcysteine carboxyl methyltransferase family protein n=1 Tax=Cellulomonas xiejunii TaxID=2968083 RepID=A0ABY5KUN0_9CELL|nr:isoprenylcysteine carboxyl methyltransferase family protein [Cellulomonas xiejunii]MCC2321653.1 isoprenylcysteine carboxyl methyltransferase family protein [Cellulomonas xiejunii]UUI72967.1 isoprenylcysteine carboxyl methyltransferase family protein [Cellulomonas xiejunii]